jgi:sugar/nucleoside kinase (ribokinase family)
MNENDQLDFLAIGDIVTDAFIKLGDAWVDKDGTSATKGQGLCVVFGDKVPFESVKVVRAVGNSANAAVAAARLGLKSGLVAWVGKDEEGAKCRETLRQNGVDDRFVGEDASYPTNYHYVLQFGAERTILVKHAPWPYSFPEVAPAPKWLYLSSLAENSEAYHGEIADYVERHPETKLAFQPGTFQMKLGKERLARIYARAEIFFCNKEEAERILGIAPCSIPELLPQVRALGPKIAVITDGPNGAYAQGEDGAILRVPMFPDRVPPVDRTGAGDATASTIVAALALGLPLAEALRWGPVNSASVVEKIGAQAGLLPRAELESRLAAAPADYAVSKI